MSDSHEVVIEPCATLDELGDLRGQIKKLRNERTFDREFLRALFEKRDKQLLPRDLLAAFLPTRRSARTSAAASGGVARRAVGILRRTLKVDSKRRSSSLHIDFVFVSKEARGLHIGRKLLNAGIRLGKQKDVRLSVAGSDDNLPAVMLYESVGFRWTNELKTEMLLDKSLLTLESDSAAMPAQASQAETVQPGPEAAGPSGVVRPTLLSVDVGAAARQPALHAASALGRSTPGASGATPHLSQLRLSPRFSSSLPTDMSSPRLHAKSPLAQPSAAADATCPVEFAMLPPPAVLLGSSPRDSSGLVHSCVHSDGKRRAPPPPAPLYTEAPEVKSIKAAHGASPRSPGGRAGPA